MTIEQFFHEYANTPMEQRFVPLDFSEMGMMTLQDLNVKLHVIEDTMRPARIERDKLLSFITNHWIKTGRI